LLNFAVAVVFINELVESSIHLHGVHFPFSVQSLSGIFERLSTDIFVNLFDVVADASLRSLLVNSQVDEFVRDDVHLLERQGLHAGSRETFKAPA